MAQYKLIAAPAYISSSVANLFTPLAAPAVTIIRHIHIVNRTTSTVTFSMYVGATGGSAAGTELYKDYSIAAKGTFDWYPIMRLKSTQFLTGEASAATSLVITISGEVDASPDL